MAESLRVTVWNEFRHERNPEHAASRLYPEGLHTPIARFLSEAGMAVRVATLDEHEHGLTEGVLAETDVLTWWGHCAHWDVQDHVVDRVQQAVLNGMGLVCLHSAHYSKIFKRLLGTSCSLKWREAREKERLWVVDRSHPITEGIPEYFELSEEEMYGETFDIPPPDELIFISWFQGGEVFRSGCTFRRGRGKVFYFRPGHETYPTYYNPLVLQVIANGVRWCAPRATPYPAYDHRAPLEPLPGWGA